MKISGACQNCGTPTRSKYGYCWQSAECRRLYKREQCRQRDRSEYNRRWYAANRERVLAQQKEYIAANRERRREYNAQWRAANPDYDRKRLAQPSRQCRVKGCAELAVDRLLYCRPHDNESQRRRRKQKQDRIAEALFERQEGMCPDADHGGCGQPLGELSRCNIDHLIPLAAGGGNEDRNLQLLHAYCNKVKQDRIVPAAAVLLAAS